MEILQGCKNSQHCSPTPDVDCFLTRFLFGFVQIFLLCNFGSFIHSCDFLVTEHLYKLSQTCNFNQSFIPLINQENWARSFLSLSWFCYLLSFSFIFLHFLGSQIPLDDDKSRDVRLKPHHPCRGRPLGVSFVISCMFSCFSCMQLWVFVFLLLTLG